VEREVRRARAALPMSMGILPRSRAAKDCCSLGAQRCNGTTIDDAFPPHSEARRIGKKSVQAQCARVQFVAANENAHKRLLHHIGGSLLVGRGHLVRRRVDSCRPACLHTPLKPCLSKLCTAAFAPEAARIAPHLLGNGSVLCSSSLPNMCGSIMAVR